MSGLSVVGRDRYGVFPLKGKLLNVRDATHSKIMKNEEVSFSVSSPLSHPSLHLLPSHPMVRLR